MITQLPAPVPKQHKPCYEEEEDLDQFSEKNLWKSNWDFRNDEMSEEKNWIENFTVRRLHKLQFLFHKKYYCVLKHHILLGNIPKNCALILQLLFVSPILHAVSLRRILTFSSAEIEHHWSSVQRHVWQLLYDIRHTIDHPIRKNLFMLNILCKLRVVMWRKHPVQNTIVT